MEENNPSTEGNKTFIQKLNLFTSIAIAVLAAVGMALAYFSKSDTPKSVQTTEQTSPDTPPADTTPASAPGSQENKQYNLN